MEMGYRSDNSRGRGRNGGAVSGGIGSRTNSINGSLNKEKEDLEMALALSLTNKELGPKTSGNSGGGGGGSSSRSSSRTSGGEKRDKDNSTAALAAADSWDDEDDDSANWEEHKLTTPPAPATIPDSKPSTDTIEDILKQNFAGSTITSFSKPSTNDGNKTNDSKTAAGASASSKKMKKKKDDEEDIFASMGLSSLLTKTSKAKLPVNSTISKNKNTPKEQSSFSPPKSNTLSAAVLSPVEDEGIENEGTWDNDSDLDDLLED